MDLKRCPFCAETLDLRIEQWETTTNDKHREYAIICGNCGGTGPNDLGHSGAIEMWNMRRMEKPDYAKTQ